ncbi:C-C motif chemokine 19a.1 [Cheilinus undulatus]|uniref:C-C motif chemokine 19a.1 n=1 Tax=Cheilinus undulatus TaxID=241271 RepID=UPI001BD5F882|nr:C-C motif chemokine 19a.1 [Cheilinus undulatus]
MALWGDTKLFFCILFISFCCCTLTLAEVPVDCCLSVVEDRQVHKSTVADFRKQISGHGCSIDATILVTRRGRELCVPPNETWVQEVEDHVINLKKYCKKHNYKRNRCFGVRHE